MPTLNQCFLIGNLTRDPELRYTVNGTAVSNGGIAVNRHWTSEDGKDKAEVCYVDFTLWSKAAETFCQYMRKGSCVMLQGYLKFEKWDDEGTTRTKLFLNVETFQFLDKPADEKNTPAPSKAPARKA